MNQGLLHRGVLSATPPLYPRRARFRPTGGTWAPLLSLQPLRGNRKCSHPDSNRDRLLRREAFCPLNYGNEPSPWSPHTGGGRLDGLCRWLKARGQSGSTTNARARQPRSIRDRARTGVLLLERKVSFANSSTRTRQSFYTRPGIFRWCARYSAISDRTRNRTRTCNLLILSQTPLPIGLLGPNPRLRYRQPRAFRGSRSGLNSALIPDARAPRVVDSTSEISSLIRTPTRT